MFLKPYKLYTFAISQLFHDFYGDSTNLILFEFSYICCKFIIVIIKSYESNY